MQVHNTKRGLCWFGSTEKEAHCSLFFFFFLRLHPGKIFSSILFPPFCMLHVVFCVQVLFAVLGSTWLPLLAATMLTFHRPNADLTLEVIPDDLLENKSLRKKREREILCVREQEQGNRKHTRRCKYTHKCSHFTKVFSPDYSLHCTSKGREK